VISDLNSKARRDGMPFNYPRKPWIGNRKNLIIGMPFVIFILSLLLYVFFFHIAPAAEDLLFPRVIVVLLTLAFVILGIYSLLRDSWWINLPFNYELFQLVTDEVERRFSENNIVYFVQEPGIMAIVPGRQAKTLEIHTEGPDLKVVIEIFNRKGQENSSRSIILIANICPANKKEAFAVKKAITDMLMDLKYNSYPNQ
jgi:hypothetical protein